MNSPHESTFSTEIAGERCLINVRVERHEGVDVWDLTIQRDDSTEPRSGREFSWYLRRLELSFTSPVLRRKGSGKELWKIPVSTR